MQGPNLVQLEQYEEFIGSEAVERILKKASLLKGCHVAFVSSTYYGGGVAELIGSTTLLLSTLGIRAEWRVIQGTPDFFSITKKMHNALQGGPINLTARKKRIYEQVVHQNAVRNEFSHDFVVVNDPQPLPLVRHYRKRGPWIWHCHIDLSRPNRQLWEYLTPLVEQYDAVVVSMAAYRQALETPQVVIMPAIDPFSPKNKDMRKDAVADRLAHYGIPTDVPLVVQVSRFDRWKDPKGVLEAFALARREVEATLVLLGNVATDDPEGEEIYDALIHHRSERVLILSREDSSLVNALQRRAHVVLQKSIREGFGLTVSEALWKGTPVIGGNVGGIRSQITDGVNGFLVNSTEEAAARIVQVVQSPDLRSRLGEAGRESVQKAFLLSRYVEQYLDLWRSFDTVYRLREPSTALDAP